MNPSIAKKKQQMTILFMVSVLVLIALVVYIVVQGGGIIGKKPKYSNRDYVENADTLEMDLLKLNAQVNDFSNRLAQVEGSMPSGDIYRWLVKTFISQKDNWVQISEVSPPREIELIKKEASITVTNVAWPWPASIKRKNEYIANMPYAESSFTLVGRATYHNFGRFLADLENSRYYAHVERLELEPAYPDTMTDPQNQKVLFKLELKMFIKKDSILLALPSFKP